MPPHLCGVWSWYLLLLHILLSSHTNAVDFQPKHIHISLGSKPNSYVVSWSTADPTPDSTVLIGRKRLDMNVTGSAELFVDGGEERRGQWIHKVELDGLAGDAYYLYRVGSSLGWSDLFYAKTLPFGNDWSPRIALFGDMGNENAVSLPHLQREVGSGNFDAVIHVGDMAYDMYEDNGRRADRFMEQIEPIASVVPYMTCPGNHENHYNFTNYKARFHMPGDPKKRMYFSFNIGPVHFVSISTEFYYYLEFGLFQLIDQFHWLDQDLRKANTQSARAKQPWVVVFGHRPMYCSNTDHDDCTKYETRTRVGLPPLKWWGLEQLLHKHRVDLAVWAHEHSYERLLPLFNRTVMPGPFPHEPYTDPGATVHITTGSAGCREKHDNFIKDPPAWSVFRSTDYGYTSMQVANLTHMHLQQISVEPDQPHVIDDFWLVKNDHLIYRNMV